MSDADLPSVAEVPEEPPAAAGGGRRMVPAGAFVVAVMAAAALGLLAVVGLAVSGDDDSDETEIRLAAGRFAERFLTFEHDGIDEWKQDVLSLSTGGFSSEVEDAESGLRRLVADNQIDATGRVTEVFVGDRARGEVDVVVLYDRDVRTAEGVRTETARYLQLTLLDVDDEWLVDQVIDIATTELSDVVRAEPDGG